MDLPHVRRWQRVQAIAWVGAVTWWLTRSVQPMAALLVAALFAVLSYAALFALVAARRPADWLTLARAAGLAAVAALAARTGQLGLLAWLACVTAVAADLLDGWVARRTGPTWAGAVLDMEADQLATLLLALLAVTLHGVGAWALLLPGYRYGYVLLSWALALPAHDPKPKGDNQRARLVCALCMVLQLAALAPGVSGAVRALCLLVALAALTYSFGDDLVFLLRQRAAARG